MGPDCCEGSAGIAGVAAERAKRVAPPRVEVVGAEPGRGGAGAAGGASCAGVRGAFAAAWRGSTPRAGVCISCRGSTGAGVCPEMWGPAPGAWAAAGCAGA